MSKEYRVAKKAKSRSSARSSPGVYRVAGDVYVDKDTERSGQESMSVIATCADEAIEKARKKITSDWWEWEDDDGKKHTSRNTAFVATCVEFVSSVDIF